MQTARLPVSHIILNTRMIAGQLHAIYIELSRYKCQIISIHAQCESDLSANKISNANQVLQTGNTAHSSYSPVVYLSIIFTKILV